MREPAPAKLNLALHVRRRREDGYHELETIFAFCIDGDWIEAKEADDLSLSIKGPFADGLNVEENLVMRAAQALQEASGTTRGATLTLDKRLPLASGIGGGSADAAATLRLLTSLWGTDTALISKTAITLGADVLACVFSLPAKGDGVGDILSPYDLSDLSGTPVLLVNPGVSLSTADIFRAWDGTDGGPLPDDWRDGRNDLEPIARARAPAIGDVLRWLEQRAGCRYARMSGSGATCFALFDTHEQRDAAAALSPEGWWHLATELR